MLVLSRRPTERIILPSIGAAIEVLDIKGDRVRLGIQAPPEIKVLREEIAHRIHCEPLPARHVAPPAGLTREQRHDLRNALNTAGIGLALARRQLQAGMIDNLEATMEKIEENFGSLAEQVTNLAPRSEQKAPESKSSGRPQKALLVEDDNNECELLAGFFRMAGYEVATASDGADAIDYLHGHETPDVMLLDMNLPRCDGPTTIRMVRRDPALSRLKIFAVSGYTPDQVGLNSREAGIQRWFQKPINPEALLREIQAAHHVPCA